MANPSGSVPFAIDGQSLSSVEEASNSVGGPLGIETLLLIIGLAVVAVGVLGILTYLYSARETVDSEIKEVEAERRAFLAFAKRIEGMPVEHTSAAMATPQSIQTFDSGGPPVHEVADAFEETVMALPHYERTYGDDVLAQMATELDPELVASLQRGSLSETAKQGLYHRATDAASKRSDLITTLETEREALEEAERGLGDIVADLRSMNEQPLGRVPYSDLGAYHSRLGDLQTQVGTVLTDRQRRIQAHKRRLRQDHDAVTLQEYLYNGDGPTYPVLDTGTRLDRLIAGAQKRVRRALWSRV